jgi:isoaspartyl peptidase/L-asparaginase-like protein (Ntn-hydrolase superfamily)
MDYVAIATWPFGMTAVKKAEELLRQGSPALDAAIAGGQAVEDDPKVHSVGYSGIPNAIGIVQLDACVMDGKTLSCGAVAGLENIRHAAALARRVMEKTPHILVVGEGARLFALREGFPLESCTTPESIALWEKMKAKRQQAMLVAPEEALALLNQIQKSEGAHPMDSHDTVAVLALDNNGSLGGACTTSGLALKLPGRVGDSPLIGHGLYVDNSAGAAGGTGVGEEIIRIGGSMRIVEAMRHGKSPQEACELAIRKVNSVAAQRGVHPAQVAFLALDPKGNIGAACTERYNFQYAVARSGKPPELLKGKEIGERE